MKIYGWKIVRFKNKKILGGIDHVFDFKLNHCHYLDDFKRCDDTVRMCGYGFHFCSSLKSLLDDWYLKDEYYRITFCEAEIGLKKNEGFDYHDNKCCSNNITILKILNYKQTLALYKMSKNRKSELELQKFALSC